MAEVRTITSGLTFPEGPVAMDDGSVVLCEMGAGTITRVTPDGEKETVAEPGYGPNGSAIGPDGKLYVCNNGGSYDLQPLGDLVLPVQPSEKYAGHGWIDRVDLETGEVERLYEDCDGEPLKGTNDIVFDASGGFWFTDHGVRDARRADRGYIYYAQPDGSQITEAAGPLDFLNGIGLSPDGKRLYVSETYLKSVWWWEVEAPGRLALVEGLVPHGGTFLHGAPGFAAFDSLGIDSDGNVCVATLARGGFTVISPETGDEIDFVQCEELMPTNICWGGEGRRTAFITASASGRLLATEWPRPGLELAFSG
jgi:gluconolactonase